MGLKNTQMEYGSLAKTLHWLIAVGLFALIYLGLEQAGMESGAWIPGRYSDKERAIWHFHRWYADRMQPSRN